MRCLVLVFHCNLQLRLYLAPFPRYYHLYPKIKEVSVSCGSVSGCRRLLLRYSEMLVKNRQSKLTPPLFGDPFEFH